MGFFSRNKTIKVEGTDIEKAEKAIYKRIQEANVPWDASHRQKSYKAFLSRFFPRRDREINRGDTIYRIDPPYRVRRKGR